MLATSHDASVAALTSNPRLHGRNAGGALPGFQLQKQHATRGYRPRGGGGGGGGLHKGGGVGTTARQIAAHDCVRKALPPFALKMSASSMPATMLLVESCAGGGSLSHVALLAPRNARQRHVEPAMP